MAIDMPQLFTIRVAGESPNRAQTRIRARKHETLIDEPPARHGQDLGPTPLETLLSSYLACTNVIANIVAEEMGITIAGMTSSLRADFDTRGVFAKADVDVPFPTIDVEFDVQTDASEAQVEALRKAVAKRCPVSVVLRAAGSRIDESWRIRPI